MDQKEKWFLQICVIAGGLVPVSAGLWGVLFGPAMISGNRIDAAMDSHFRYLSGLLLATGLGFWSTVPDIETKTARFRVLTGLVVVGGLGRLVRDGLASDTSIQTLHPPRLASSLPHSALSPDPCIQGTQGSAECAGREAKASGAGLLIQATLAEVPRSPCIGVSADKRTLVLDAPARLPTGRAFYSVYASTRPRPSYSVATRGPPR